MLIYNMVFGTDSGQVTCAFHKESRASAGIGPNGEYNCFVCGAKAHSPISFICRYFHIGEERATRIHKSFNDIQNNKYMKQKLNDEQFNYLKSVGINERVAKKYFFSSAAGKLQYHHTWNGYSVGFTWFNAPELSTYNAGHPKYRYYKNNTGGILTPMDDAIRYKTLLITEGEKDMLTAKSIGFPNAVAKVGGAKTWVLGGVPVKNKQIVIIYDCDDWGREGAIQDATLLTEKFGCKVKVIDLGLQDKEDLNDYFIKYKHTKDDLIKLIKNTSVFVPVPKAPEDKLQSFVDALSENEIRELADILIKYKSKEN